MNNPEYTIVFPHQLFKEHPALAKSRTVVLIEHPLFFGTDEQYPSRMHVQKLVLLRAAMKAYEQYVQRNGYTVEYIECRNASLHQIQALFSSGTWHIARVVDYALEQQLEALSVSIEWYESPMFLNSTVVNQDYKRSHKDWQMQSFYKFQRKRLGILMDGNDPVGERWSFDEFNRKKVPKDEVQNLPVLLPITATEFHKEAKEYVENTFHNTIGYCRAFYYPVTHSAAEEWLQTFLEERFIQFGPYEDAIEPNKDMLFHSIVTPMLNIGLITPKQVLAAVEEYVTHHVVPIESHEGFIRQIIGWREFIRATYEDCGVYMRTGNHWQHSQAMPEGFYNATTGIEPIDNCIQRILETGYCHHIERLMVLGGFMFLCEIDPNHIYTWFMEMFIDSYDWVMVPNVYGMSQNTRAELITTKPYFSGANYINTMSHYPNGTWQDMWNGLYWKFIDKHAHTLSKNPRWSMMCSAVRKMDPGVLNAHKHAAQQCSKWLFGEGLL